MKQRSTSSLAKIAVLTFIVLFTAYPCTTVVIKRDGKLLFGRNLDWICGTGLVMVNPRNLQKEAIGSPSQHPAAWTARYGSVTFNQIGRELPFGGINETGLVVEHMTLESTVYPARDSRRSINAFQWIQFQLDNFSTVEEVIASDKFLRIDDDRNKIHFLVCDRQGHSAVIEFLEGRMVCHTGTDLPVRALANSTYDESIRSLNNDNRSNPSLDHFCTAAKRAADADTTTDTSAVDYAFHSLNMVSQGLFTKWSIVYDITTMQIRFKIYETPTIDGENKIFRKQPPYDPPVKIVRIADFDFSRPSESRVLDLDDPHDNVVNPYFVHYSTAINKEFITKAITFYKGWGIKINLNDEELEGLSRYPESFQAQTVRPIADSIGFCWNAEEMNNFISFLSKEDGGTTLQTSNNLVAAISVHDDYLYAGKIYYSLYQHIKTKEVVIFGVTHGSVRKAMGSLSNVLILDEFDQWRGPYKNVGISPLREIIKSKLPKDDFMISNKAQSIEHSIEAAIPFLQYYNPDIKITPMMVTPMPFERMEEVSKRLARIVVEYIRANKLVPGKDIFFLISNDANHYGEDFSNTPYGLDAHAHTLATENDRRIITQHLVAEINEAGIRKLTKELWPDSTHKQSVPLWCGRYPIPMGLLTVANILDELGVGTLHGDHFRYSDTFTEKVLPVKNTSMGLTAVFSYKHWCGWFTEGFYLKREAGKQDDKLKSPDKAPLP